MSIMRLDRIIATTGRFSRREAKKLVSEGRVVVDGAVPASAECKYDPELSDIRIDGEPLVYSDFVYYMLNKPKGYICATEDGSLPTVMELLPEHLRRRGLFPVGRLDRDTTGLLLLTDDGNFAHDVISPKKHVPKLYAAQLDRPADASDAEAFAAGLVLGDGTQCLPARLYTDGVSCRALVEISEGKYHQVKRMFAARGKHVQQLHRRSIGSLQLDPELAPGQGRELTAEEAKSITVSRQSRRY